MWNGTMAKRKATNVLENHSLNLRLEWVARKLKVHFNMSSNDFAFTGMASIHALIARSGGSDTENIVIAISPEVYKRLTDQLKSEETKKTLFIRPGKFIHLFDEVYAYSEHKHDDQIVWIKGYRFLNKHELKEELNEGKGKARSVTTRENYDNLIKKLR